ncbi:MAG: hypothetical protein JWL90_4442 [Chthoniobacteraceae bacterium]|nr:hypothetical protein [Chthoniobacteraceae bacterium]MDB6174048.1 hypothetical protein [Chthoniobacteraceae bacterium]
MLTLLFLIASLAVLVLGSLAGIHTGNKSVWANTAFASLALLFGARHAYAGINLEWTVMLAFFVTMIIGGRALGTWLRSRREKEFRTPACLLIAAAACAGAVTIQAFYTL